MQLSTRPRTGKKPPPRRGAAATGDGTAHGDGWRVLLLEVAREILRGSHRGRPPRTFMDVAVRLSPTLVLASVTVALGGRAGRWVSLLLVGVVVLLLLLAAVERWIVLPVLGGLRKLSAIIPRLSSRSREKPSSTGDPDRMQRRA